MTLQDFQTINIGTVAVQIANAATGPVLLTNKSTTNSIFLSYQQSIDTGIASSAGTIDPLGSLEIDPQATIWAVCAPNQTATLQLIPYGSSYGPSPIAIATQILNSGVILVDNPVTIESSNALSIGAGATITGTIHDVRTLQSWSLNWVPNSSSAGTQPYVRCTIQWFSDPSGLYLIWAETWFLPASQVLVGGAAGWAHVFGNGPMRGAYMNISFTSQDSISQSFQYFLGGSNRTQHASTLRSDFAGQIQGQYGTDDVLAFNATNSLAAGSSTAEQPINYYNGRVIIKLRATGTSVAANTLFFHLKTQPIQDFLSVDNTALSFPVTNPGPNSADQLYEFYLPKRPCTYTIQNTGSVAATIRALIVADGGKP